MFNMRVQHYQRRKPFSFFSHFSQGPTSRKYTDVSKKFYYKSLRNEFYHLFLRWFRLKTLAHRDTNSIKNWKELFTWKFCFFITPTAIVDSILRAVTVDSNLRVVTVDSILRAVIVDSTLITLIFICHFHRYYILCTKTEKKIIRR